MAYTYRLLASITKVAYDCRTNSGQIWLFRKKIDVDEYLADAIALFEPFDIRGVKSITFHYPDGTMVTRWCERRAVA